MRRWLMMAAIAAAVAAAFTAHADAASMILNEYNAVRSDLTLKSPGSDTHFGIIPGNGGDWMELVIIQDMLDIRNWRLVTTQNGAPDALIVLPDVPVLGALRSGTILTIAEEVATDWSYAPAYDPADPNGAGDWWINFQASFSAGDSTHSNFQVTIRDAADNLVFGPAGEGISPVSGIGSDEVFKLEADPSDSITANSSFYKDGTSSTFGAPNKWSSGTITQNFGPLRSVVPEPASGVALASGLAALATLRRRSR